MARPYFGLITLISRFPGSGQAGSGGLSDGVVTRREAGSTKLALQRLELKSDRRRVTVSIGPPTFPERSGGSGISSSADGDHGDIPFVPVFVVSNAVVASVPHVREFHRWFIRFARLTPYYTELPVSTPQDSTHDADTQGVPRYRASERTDVYPFIISPRLLFVNSMTLNHPRSVLHRSVSLR